MEQNDIIDGQDQDFHQQVLEASNEKPVLVDFWAPWCNPCKQLGPELEKITRNMKGRIKLVKINIDEQPMIAGQLGVQSIPAVFAFFSGRPVDGFMGAVSQTQLKSFIDKLLQKLNIQAPADDPDFIVEQAHEKMQAQDFAFAYDLFSGALKSDPTHVKAHAGMLSALIRLNRLDDAARHLEQLNDKIAQEVEIVEARKKLETALAGSEKADQIDVLAQDLSRDPDNLQKKFDYAMALFGANQFEDSFKQL
ncbi:MAG: thioredoxin, partial [Pseudomonadota bacterium]